MNADQQANRILDFEGFPGYWKFRKSTKETNGERFEIYMKIEESGALPPHKSTQRLKKDMKYSQV